jgi:hypothetical protein
MSSDPQSGFTGADNQPPGRTPSIFGAKVIAVNTALKLVWIAVALAALLAL